MENINLSDLKPASIPEEPQQPPAGLPSAQSQGAGRLCVVVDPACSNAFFTLTDFTDYESSSDQYTRLCIEIEGEVSMISFLKLDS